MLREAIYSNNSCTRYNLLEVRRLIKKNYIFEFGKYTDKQDINENKLNITYCVICLYTDLYRLVT
jgi:hypothetical protein